MLPPTTTGTALLDGATAPGLFMVSTDVPTCRMVSKGPVDKTTTVFDDSEPTVTDDPGTSVWPEMMY